MEDAKVEQDGTWLCEHEGGHVTRLDEKDALPDGAHYVICPDCGTHYIVWTFNLRRWAKAVIVPIYG